MRLFLTHTLLLPHFYRAAMPQLKRCWIMRGYIICFLDGGCHIWFLTVTILDGVDSTVHKGVVRIQKKANSQSRTESPKYDMPDFNRSDHTSYLINLSSVLHIVCEDQVEYD